MMYAGSWGTVCDDDWDFADARVACREAGCGPALGATGLGHFGYGRGPVLLDNVGCAGTEARLSDCFHLGWGQHNCGHHEDAGALCLGEVAPRPHSSLLRGWSGVRSAELAVLRSGAYCGSGGARYHLRNERGERTHALRRGPWPLPNGRSRAYTPCGTRGAVPVEIWAEPRVRPLPRCLVNRPEEDSHSAERDGALPMMCSAAARHGRGRKGSALCNEKVGRGLGNSCGSEGGARWEAEPRVGLKVCVKGGAGRFLFSAESRTLKVPVSKVDHFWGVSV